MLSNHDFVKQLVLPQQNGLHSHHLQNGQERGDQGAAAGLAFKDFPQQDRLVFAEKQVFQIGDAAFDGNIAAGNFIGRPVLRALQHVLKRLDEIEYRDGQAGIFVFLDKRLKRRIRPRALLDQALFPQHLRGLPERFVLDQLLNQLFPRIF